MLSLVAIIFAGIGVAGRLLPHAANFAPVGALALWSGAYLPKRWSVVVPLAVMFVSDAIIGFYNPLTMVVVYGSFAAIAWLGWFVREKKTAGGIALASFGGSCLFYLTTNFAVWFSSSWYPPTLAGLEYCYFLALPFFKNTLLGDFTYAAVFFGTYELARYINRRRATSVSIVSRVPIVSLQ